MRPKSEQSAPGIPPISCKSLPVSKFESSATNPANPRRPIWRPEVPGSCSVDYNGVMLRSAIGDDTCLLTRQQDKPNMKGL